jgi:hypothetical protein
MSEQKTPPSILTQTEALIDEQVSDGIGAGVLVRDGEVGAEVSAKKDIGKPGGWQLGGFARWTKAKGKEAAATIRWTPKA